jgi:hypothetical protein
VIASTILVVVAGAPLLLKLPFDFNPVNLQDPKSPSVVTYHELQKTSESTGKEAEVVAPSLGEADKITKRLAGLPEVSRSLTLNSFVPSEQNRKIAVIKTACRERRGRSCENRRRRQRSRRRGRASCLRSAQTSRQRRAGTPQQS